MHKENEAGLTCLVFSFGTFYFNLKAFRLGVTRGCSSGYSVSYVVCCFCIID
jgi:hypothetical protein